jgi:exonuclease III
VVIHLLVAYAPTAEADEAEKTEFYNALENAIWEARHELLIILGDFNARLLHKQF